MIPHSPAVWSNQLCVPTGLPKAVEMGTALSHRLEPASLGRRLAVIWAPNDPYSHYLPTNRPNGTAANGSRETSAKLLVTKAEVPPLRYGMRGEAAQNWAIVASIAGQISAVAD